MSPTRPRTTEHGEGGRSHREIRDGQPSDVSNRALHAQHATPRPHQAPPHSNDTDRAGCRPTGRNESTVPVSLGSPDRTRGAMTTKSEVQQTESPPAVESLPEYQRKRRQRIIEAAVELLADGEYETIQVRDVAERAGTSLGTLYRYFSSKEHLYAAAILEWSSNFSLPGRKRPQRRAQTDEERLRQLMARTIRALERQPQMMRAQMILENSNDPNAKALYRQFGVEPRGHAPRRPHRNVARKRCRRSGYSVERDDDRTPFLGPWGARTISDVERPCSGRSTSSSHLLPAADPVPRNPSSRGTSVSPQRDLNERESGSSLRRPPHVRGPGDRAMSGHKGEGMMHEGSRGTCGEGSCRLLTAAGANRRVGRTVRDGCSSPRHRRWHRRPPSRTTASGPGWARSARAARAVRRAAGASARTASKSPASTTPTTRCSPGSTSSSCRLVRPLPSGATPRVASTAARSWSRTGTGVSSTTRR